MIDEIMEELLLFLTYTYMDAHNITVKGLLYPIQLSAALYVFGLDNLPRR